MEKYKVRVTEILSRIVEIEADDENDAINKVEGMYKSEDIVLTADDYLDTKIEAANDDIIKESEEQLRIYNHLEARFDIITKELNKVKKAITPDLDELTQKYGAKYYFTVPSMETFIDKWENRGTRNEYITIICPTDDINRVVSEDIEQIIEKIRKVTDEFDVVVKIKETNTNDGHSWFQEWKIKMFYTI